MDVQYPDSRGGSISSMNTSMATTNLSDKAKNLLERYIHLIVIFLFSVGIFIVIAIMNPQTLVWVGLVQLDCDLPEHSKCVAEQPLSKLFGGD